MTYKRIIRGGLASLAFLSFFVACMSVQSLSTSSEDTESLGEGELEIKFSSNISTTEYQKYMDGIAFYLFNPDNYLFLQELSVNNVDKTTGGSYVYTTSEIAFGEYDLVIVSHKDSIQTSTLASRPAYKTDVMYAMPNNETKCPNIFYVSEAVIFEQKSQQVEATMSRNISAVLIRVDDENGLLDHSKEVKVSLSGVPSTLSWEGKFMSSNGVLLTVDLPSISTTNWVEDSGVYQTEDMKYYIPAHRGNDVPEYTLTINVEATDSKSASFTRTVTIEGDYLPKRNKITRYNLIPQGANLEIVVETLDWNVEEEQEEVINGESDLACIAMKTYGTTEVPIMDVYNEWNTSEGMFYNLNNSMSQTTEVVAEIVENTNTDGAVKSVEIVNRAGSWPHAVLRVDSNGTEGEATVGIKLENDNNLSTNGGYRWKWHVKVSADGDACTTNGHPDSVNSSN